MGNPGSNLRHGVPAELSSFVGRERELARTAALLGTERLVILVGPAGIGKTRLALRTVRALGRGGVDVVWADLGSLPAPVRDDLADELERRLGGCAALLVLDGCEHLGESAGALADRLLTRLPRVRILATSQRTFAFRNGAEVAVGPLPLPPEPPDPAIRRRSSDDLPSDELPGGDLPAGDLPGGTGADPAGEGAEDGAGAGVGAAEIAGYASVRLYAERARGADPSFALTDRNAAAVAALCRALDGIPGALELAAGRAGRYRPAEALRRLTADPLGFLAEGAGRAGGADVLRAHRLSSPGERLLWTRLSVFAGSFDEAAVAQVCGFGELGPEDAAETLRRLAPALLAEPGEPGRYRLPLSVRAYEARRLAHAPGTEAALAERRHHERYRVIAERAAWLWRSGAQPQARALALRELPELRRAMDPLSEAGPAGALEVAVSLWFLWSACGLEAEGRRRLERALALHPEPRPARALCLAAWLAAAFGRAGAADPLLVEAWRAAVLEGEDAALACLAHARGTAALWQDRPGEAADEYRDALEQLPSEPEFGPGREALRASLAMALAYTDPASVPLGDGGPDAPADLWARAWSDYAHALVERRNDRPALARTRLVAALEIQLALGDRLGQALSAELLAELEAGLGHYEESAKLLGAVSGSRPAAACAPRAERILRARMTPEAFRAAHEEGTRSTLRDLLPEL
ncbi:ATP-binding protein [Streptomyces sp. NPDC090077]|uniref:ATP-binding protein n=1 Tax=Streptomyces sp. NPDC090077 TaxID=3365938 RepID=UPI003805A594